jgi:CRP-like cAMP-binding protein
MSSELEIFKTYLKGKVDLSEEQFKFWSSLLVTRKIEKNQYLLQEGEVSHFISFVLKGCLRLYSSDARGKEHILQFAPEFWWVGDIESFSKKTPSLYYIDAIEDSEVLLMDHAAQDKLFHTIPEAAIFFQELMQNRQAATQKRIIFSMSASAEERYLDFIKTYPSFLQRIPQHMIAAYLGITPESLSRIRKQVISKK